MRKRMKICSRLSVFLAMFGWSIAGGFMYGGYPPPEKIFAHLVGVKNDVNARFKRLFGEVREEAAESRMLGQSDPRKLVGEERGLISGKTGNEYLADDERCWLRRYFVDGDFLVKIDGLTVQKAEDTDELMQYKKYRDGFAIATKRGCWKGEWYANLADIFKTLASEAFAERLLGKVTVDAFCTQTKNSRAVVYVFLSPNLRKSCASTVSFCLMYRRVQEGTGRAYYPFWIGFEFKYDIENNRFTDTPVNLSTFVIGDYRIGTKVR